jgi:hypothetical protein
MPKYQVLPNDPTIVNSFIEGCRNVRVIPYIGLEDLQPVEKVAVTYEPALDAEMVEKAQEEMKVLELKRLASWIYDVLCKVPDSGAFMELKNAEQKRIWLMSHGAGSRDVPTLIELLKPEMKETLARLASSGNGGIQQ